jgi:hypothetical protein
MLLQQNIHLQRLDVTQIFFECGVLRPPLSDAPDGRVEESSLDAVHRS